MGRIGVAGHSLGSVVATKLAVRGRFQALAVAESGWLTARGRLAPEPRLEARGVGAMARVGADVLPGEGFVGRGELVLSLSWFGLERATQPGD